MYYRKKVCLETVNSGGGKTRKKDSGLDHHGCSNEGKWMDWKSGSVKEASGLVEWKEGDKSVKGDSQLSGLTKHVNCDPICCDGEERERDG